MQDFLSNQELEIKCPNCSKSIKKTVAWFKGSGRTCPGCGAAFETRQFSKDIDKAEKSLKDFGKLFK